MITMRSALVFVLIGTAAGAAHAQNRDPSNCGGLHPEGSNMGMFGPYDYTNKANWKEKLPLVERHHFSTDVETLRRGITTRPPAPDLNYTLLAFPNHHRALVSLVNLSFREKTNKPKHMEYSVDCFFDRAMRFKPHDKRVQMIYGTYLMRNNKYKEALKFFDNAEDGLKGDPNFHYNRGLLHVELKQWDKAADDAAVAYSAGFNLPGLRDKLSRAGKWDEVERKLKRSPTASEGSAVLQATTKPE
jgi:hypothetical protein